MEFRQYLYCNQVVSWWEMSFDVGAINEAWLRGAARELFASDVSRRWREARSIKRGPLARSPYTDFFMGDGPQ